MPKLPPDPDPGRWSSRVPRRPKKAGRVTHDDIRRYPSYYVVGPGRPAADETRCPHGRKMIVKCPDCP
jgi:hypothetical protein